jgi:hypothetical protein
MDLEDLQARRDNWARLRDPTLLAVLDLVPEPRLSDAEDLPHWRCSDCGAPCFCSIPYTAHRDCGRRDASWVGVGEPPRPTLPGETLLLSSRPDPARPSLDEVGFGE